MAVAGEQAPRRLGRLERAALTGVLVREVVNFSSYWKSSTFSSTVEPTIYLLAFGFGFGSLVSHDRRLRLRRVRRHGHGRDRGAVLERVPGDVRDVRQVPVPAHLRRDPRRARRHRGARDRGGALDRDARERLRLRADARRDGLRARPVVGDARRAADRVDRPGFGWACFGISVAGFSKSFENFNYVVSAVLTPLFLVAGTFFPLERAAGVGAVPRATSTRSTTPSCSSGTRRSASTAGPSRCASAFLVAFGTRALAGRDPRDDAQARRLRGARRLTCPPRFVRVGANGRGGQPVAVAAAAHAGRREGARAPAPLVLWAIGVGGLAVTATTIAFGLASEVSGSRSRCSSGSACRTSSLACVAWWRRPDSRLGVLMIAGGFASRALRAPARRSRARTHGRGDLRHPPGGALPARVPRVPGRPPALAVRAHARGRRVRDRDRPPAREAAAGRVPELARADVAPGVALWVERTQLVSISAICLVGLGVLATRRRRAGAPAPALADAADRLVRPRPRDDRRPVRRGAIPALSSAFQPIQRATLFVIGISPVVFLVGLLDARLARSAVGDLIIELRSDLPPTELRHATGTHAARPVAHARLLAAGLQARTPTSTGTRSRCPARAGRRR